MAETVTIQWGVDDAFHPVTTGSPLPVAIISGGGGSGGLTNTELRAAAVPVSTAAADAGLVALRGTGNKTLADIVAALVTVAVTGPLTDAQLRATAIPVSPVSGALTDRSGTITTGGTAQNAVASNSTRRYLRIRNPVAATETLWIRLTGTAAAASPSTPLEPGEEYVWEGSFIPTNALSVFAATTGHAFTSEEG